VSQPTRAFGLLETFVVFTAALMPYFPQSTEGWHGKRHQFQPNWVSSHARAASSLAHWTIMAARSSDSRADGVP
jgi:hypothetical protein